MTKVFSTLSKSLLKEEKHFNTIHLNNTFIKELDENAFNDLSFDKIEIIWCSNLTTIHRNAFSSSELVVKNITISYNTFLKDISIYDVLNRLLNVEEINLYSNNFHEIPSNAFKALKSLKTLRLSESFAKLGTKAFAQLNNLTKIEFFYLRSFEHIPDFAFEFEQPSDQTLNITFGDSVAISSSIFSAKTFVNIRRPTRLTFFNYYNGPQRITYLDEKVFLPFLLENSKNVVELITEELNCNDCRNYWMKQHSVISNRITFQGCTNKRPLNYPGNFNNC